MNKKVTSCSFFFVFLFISGCVSTPPFDHTEYERAISLKVDALTLLGNASKNFQSYHVEIMKVRRDMRFMLEYAKNKSNNEESIALWERMNDPNGDYLGNALKEWEVRGSMPEAFVAGLSSIISDRFDDIIELLGKRIKK